jgi:hypothetical protein
MDFIRVPQPPYSLDVAPSDFVLFVFLKERLDGTTFSKETDLILAVSPILTQISFPTIVADYRSSDGQLDSLSASGD